MNYVGFTNITLLSIYHLKNILIIRYHSKNTEIQVGESGAQLRSKQTHSKTQLYSIVQNITIMNHFQTLTLSLYSPFSNGFAIEFKEV